MTPEDPAPGELRGERTGLPWARASCRHMRHGQYRDDAHAGATTTKRHQLAPELLHANGTWGRGRSGTKPGARCVDTVSHTPNGATVWVVSIRVTYLPRPRKPPRKPKMDLVCDSHHRLASLPDTVLVLVIRDLNLPRNALLRLRLTCQRVCNRLSTLIADEPLRHAIGFERRLRTPAKLDEICCSMHEKPSAAHVAAFLQRLCGRFGIRVDTWTLSLRVQTIRSENGQFLSCSGMSACEVLAAVGTTPLRIQLTVSHIHRAGIEALAPVLGGMVHLTSLRLGFNHLAAAGIASLVPALSKTTKLTELDLSWNYLGDTGAALLAPALAKMTKLTSLDLSRNKLGAVGAASLAPALAKMMKLTSLRLHANNLATAGIASLVPALSKTTKLTELDLYSNNLDDGGAASLVPSLLMMTKLTDLRLEPRYLGAAGIASLPPLLSN